MNNSLFFYHLREKHTNCVELHDYSMDEVKTIMTKLSAHDGTAPITLDNLGLFLRFSDQFDCSELKRQCEEFIFDQFVAFYASEYTPDNKQQLLHRSFVDVVRDIFSHNEQVCVHHIIL
mgnify:CR=1 FL=1